MGIAALVPALVMATGLLLSWLLVRPRPRAIGWIETLAWAPAIGFGGLSLLFFFFKFLNLGNPGPVVVLAVVLGVSAIIVAVSPPKRREEKDTESTLPEAEAKNRSGELSSTAYWTSRAALALTGSGLGVAFVTWSLQWPYGTADAVNIWNTRARFLLLADRPMSQILQAIERGNPDYPLMLPASIAGQAAVWGSWDLAIPQATQVAFVCGLAAMTCLGIDRFGHRALAVPGTALLLAAPVLWRWAFSQGADLPMAYLLVASAVGLAMHLTGRPSPLQSALAGWCLGLLPWTKFEGLVLLTALAVSFGVAWFLVGSHSHGADLRSILMVVTGALPSLIAFVLFRAFWAPVGNVTKFVEASPVAKLADPTLWATAMRTIGEVMHPLDEQSLWGWIPLYLLVCVLILGVRRGSFQIIQVFMGLALLLAILTIFMIYVTTPFGLVHHIQKSADRLFLQLLPLGVVWVFSLACGNTQRVDDELG